MIIAGIDEVGRGALAGPVIAAVVVLTEQTDNIPDSKKLSSKGRNELFNIIIQKSYFAIGSANIIEIDQLNILNATLLAMKRAAMKLKIIPDQIIIDGRDRFLHSGCEVINVIKGDEKIPQVAAASIIAKVMRDRLMVALHNKYPVYSWDKNKGYGTKAHIEAIFEFGITKYHRKSFAPTKEFLES